MLSYINLLRPTHYVKNGFLILPIFFSGGLLSLSIETYLQLFLSFVVFCLSSSLIYIINDVKDVNEDRLHPKKCKRPIASGVVPVNKAYIVLFFLLVFIFGSFYILKPLVSFFILIYIFINLLYCFLLKNISILDVAIISIGFVLRVLVGGFAVDVVVTEWLIILVFLLMFSLGLAKRRDDLVLNSDTGVIYRKSQHGYTTKFIDVAISISFSVTLVAYIIYSISSEVTARFGSPFVYISSLPVFIGILRYIQLSIIEKKSGSPVEVLLKDYFLIVTIGIWLSIFVVILYL